MRFFVLLAVLVANVLLGKGVPLQPSQREILKMPVLHRLLRTGQRQEFTRLLSQMTDYVNDLDAEGATPLHWLVYTDDVELAELALIGGADPHLVDDHGRGAIHEVARLGSNDMLKLILEEGGDPNRRDTNQQFGWNALFWNAFSGRADVMQTLLQHVDPHIKDSGNMDVIGIAVQGEDPHKLDKIRLLLDAGVVPNPLMAMLATPLEELPRMADLLTEYSDNMDFGYVDVNIASQNGITPLMHAGLAGSVAAAQLLLKLGVDINVENSIGLSALVSAFMRENSPFPRMTEAQRDVAKLLLEQGIRTRNKSGMFAFRAALQRDDVEMATWLLENVTEGDLQRQPVPSEWFYANNGSALQIANSDPMRQLLSQYGADDKAAHTPRAVRPHRDWSDPRDMPSFLQNMNGIAAQGGYSPFVGREQEVQRVIRILGRKEKNNPLLVGNTGVGKTKIAEGLAQRIVAGDVPPSMLAKQIFALDMGALQALASNPLTAGDAINSFMKFMADNRDAILFVDEAHQILGMANMFKPALARGELRCIGATTHDEYQRHFMEDKALARRFSQVKVDPLSAADTLAALAERKGVYESFFGIDIDDSALQAAVEMSQQYVSDNNQPDKAIDLLDEASSKLQQDTQDEQPRLMREHLAAIIAEQIGLPVERILQSKQERILELLPWLKTRIFGQDQVLEEVSSTLVTSFTGLGDPTRPLASFLFQGPTGSGKTELAKVLAEFLFGSEDKMVRIDLSEYGREHDVASLIGSPKGYVGYDSGGILTEAVRKEPFSLVLFDEVGKAHANFTDILLQVLDDGVLTDKKGNTVDFRNTIVVLTSNALNVERQPFGFADADTSVTETIVNEQDLKPEVRGRLKILTFQNLGQEIIGKLIDRQLAELNARLQPKGISIELTDKARAVLRKEGYDPELGARPLHDAFLRRVSNPLAEMIAAGKVAEGKHYRVDLNDDGAVVTDSAAQR